VPRNSRLVFSRVLEIEYRLAEGGSGFQRQKSINKIVFYEIQYHAFFFGPPPLCIDALFIFILLRYSTKIISPCCFKNLSRTVPLIVIDYTPSPLYYSRLYVSAAPRPTFSHLFPVVTRKGYAPSAFFAIYLVPFDDPISSHPLSKQSATPAARPFTSRPAVLLLTTFVYSRKVQIGRIGPRLTTQRLRLFPFSKRSIRRQRP
jgi:hypothetical protein